MNAATAVAQECLTSKVVPLDGVRFALSPKSLCHKISHAAACDLLAELEDVDFTVDLGPAVLVSGAHPIYGRMQVMSSAGSDQAAVISRHRGILRL